MLLIDSQEKEVQGLIKQAHIEGEWIAAEPLIYLHIPNKVCEQNQTQNCNKYSKGSLPDKCTRWQILPIRAVTQEMERFEVQIFLQMDS